MIELEQDSEHGSAAVGCCGHMGWFMVDIARFVDFGRSHGAQGEFWYARFGPGAYCGGGRACAAS